MNSMTYSFVIYFYYLYYFILFSSTKRIFLLWYWHWSNLTYAFFFRFSFTFSVPNLIRFFVIEYHSGTKCRVFYWSLLHGYASQHNNQRPLHSSNSVIWWLPRHKHTMVANVDEVSINGSLRLSEYADSGIWRRYSYKVSIENIARYIILKRENTS